VSSRRLRTALESRHAPKYETLGRNNIHSGSSIWAKRRQWPPPMVDSARSSPPRASREPADREGEEAAADPPSRGRRRHKRPAGQQMHPLLKPIAVADH
jgi:hypothetical protein